MTHNTGNFTKENTYKTIVAKGYDEIADKYVEWTLKSKARDGWIQHLVAHLPESSFILDLGCGAGVPVAKRLCSLGHNITGVDGSKRQIELAKRNVPAGKFIHADMTSVEFRPASFDGVIAFYSITHVPATEQGGLVNQIASWLKPGGMFIGSFGTGQAMNWQGEWLGTDMFFSHNAEQDSVANVTKAGLQIQIAEVVKQDDEDAEFLWIVATKPL